MYFHKITLFLLALLLSNATFALSTDREQPVQIEADKATVNNIKRTITYKGNVVITQGSIRIHAASVTLNYTQKQEIAKVVAIGHPARFRQRLSQNEELKAKAKEMEYNAFKNLLYLRKEAELRKNIGGKNTYISTAPYIIYDVQRGIIKANKGQHQDGRISMTFKPIEDKK